MSASSFNAAEPAMYAGIDVGRSAFTLLLKSFLSAALLFACAVPVSSQAEFECLIKADRKDEFLVVRAIAKSVVVVSGTYRLVLIKHSAAGTSQSIQQGSFQLQPGLDNILATTMVDAGNQVELSARLLIETDRGTSQCGLPE
jgi:hypothetical protein